MDYIKKYAVWITIAFGLAALIKPELCFLILGSLALYFGISTKKFLRAIKRNGIECAGTILEFTSDSDGYKTPSIEFTTNSGEHITGQPSFYTTSDLSKLRSYENLLYQPVSVMYDPNDPKKFILTDHKDIENLVLAICILFGGVFIGVAVCSLSGYIKLR